MSVFLIPLSPNPQTFAVSLAGTTFQLTCIYRDAPNAGWTLDIDDQQGNHVLHGIPLVTGCDLLAQYAYLNLGGSLVVQSDGQSSDVPTFANLGVTSNLYFVTP